MKFLVTAGPTREAIDPVRFISNRSSGKMGYAIAGAAVTRGHQVVLVSGPVALKAPAGVQLLLVTAAEEMCRAVLSNVAWCDALVMAAAVADWRPEKCSEAKVKKDAGPWVLRLERTADILSAVRTLKEERTVVGFAAETHDVMALARDKLVRKGVDLMVANDVSRPDAGFEVDMNRVSFLAADGSEETLPLMSKTEVAQRIIGWVETARAGT